MKILKFIILAVMSISLVSACDVNQSGENFEKEKPQSKNLTLKGKAKLDAGQDEWKKPKGNAHKIVISFRGNFFSSNPGVGLVPDER